MQQTDPAIASTVQELIPAWWPHDVDLARAQAGAHGTFNFGDAIGEARAALEQNAIYPLMQLGSLQAQGADVDSFLQGQLSNDIARLSADSAQLSSYNSPKGRVIALLTLSRHAESVRLETAAELTPALIKRLRMYVMRAKVQWTDISASHPLLGLSGPDAVERLNAAGLPVPASEWAITQSDEVAVMRRPGAIARFTVQAPAAKLGAIWTVLARGAQAAGSAAWQLLDILAGQPSIVAATQEHFVAQMLNLDTLGGISFTKGCYPGQEVVARLHYLGNLKRRMLLAYSDSVAAPGTSIHSANGDAQAVGEVVNSAMHPQQGAASLIVLQTQHADASGLCIGSPQGAPLRIETAHG